MLLCDKCDRGHHLYCLRPALTCVPDGEWFCAKCRPKDVEKTPRKIRQSFLAAGDISSDGEAASSMNDESNDAYSNTKKRRAGGGGLVNDESDENEEMDVEEVPVVKKGRGAGTKSTTVVQKTVNGNHKAVNFHRYDFYKLIF